MKPHHVCIAVCALAAPFARGDHPLALLCAQYPGVRVQSVGANHRYFFGAAMTSGATEAAAAATFLNEHGAAFGGQAATGSPEVRELWNMPSADGRFVAYAYRQRIRGKDVDGSDIRIKVRRGIVPRVDFASARLAGEPTAGSETPVLTAQVASLVAQALSGASGLVIEGDPQLVVLRGTSRRPDTWCWRLETRVGDTQSPKRTTYYIDTTSPRIVHVRNNFHNWDTTPGTVQGAGTSHAYPILPYQGAGSTLVTHGIPGIRVDGTVGLQSAHTYTDQDGDFALNLGDPNQSLLVSSTFAQPAQWYRVYYGISPEYIQDSELTKVGSTVPLVLGNSSIAEERRVAQVDTVVTANRARNFFMNYISSAASQLSYQLVIFPNQAIGGVCNGAAGWVTSPTPLHWMAFAPQTAPGAGACWNFGTHSWAAHEYGHVALYTLDIAEADGAFQEGYADTYANMLNDDSVQGRGQRVDGTTIREDPTSTAINCQYPISSHTTTYCTCDAHNAGQLLSGPWVRIRNGLKSYYGSSAGLEYARVLFGHWTLVTMGGDEDCSPAHPGVLAEVMSVTESAVELNLIQSSFAAHGIEVEVNP
jgi:hypothetical protein